MGDDGKIKVDVACVSLSFPSQMNGIWAEVTHMAVRVAQGRTPSMALLGCRSIMCMKARQRTDFGHRISLTVEKDVQN
jgi:hypothetical protein